MIAPQQTLELAWKYYRAGQLREAEQLYLQLLQVDAGQADASHMLGLIAGQSGQYALAVDYLQAAIRLKPDFADARNNLGNVFILQSKLPEAVECFREAVRSRPDFAAAHNNLGNALRQLGYVDLAVASLREALRLRPDYEEARRNLSLALQAQEQRDAEARSFGVGNRPDDAEIYFNRALALSQQGKYEEAATNYQQALRLRPGSAGAHNNLGNIFVRQGKFPEAVESFRQALACKPDFAQAYGNLGDALRELGFLDESLAAHRSALTLDPTVAFIHSSMILTLNYHPGYDAGAIKEECARWNRTHAEPLKQLIQPHANHADPERRLRIGYVSGDFREHVDAFFLNPLLSSHDHEHYEIVCYANVQRPDAMTERLRGYADLWRSTVELADQQVAELVRSDQIDILVDLEMHAAHNRLLVFARKPAPVQAAWLGYPGTTGLSTMDYRLTDPYLDPPGLFDAFYSEKSIRLPETFWCYDPLIDGLAVNALPALETGNITFGCLNGISKINEGCLALWADVLRKVPGSRLLLRAPRGRAWEWIIATFQKEGIALSRIELLENMPRPEYLATYQRIDLGLDPLPYNGHTTSLDAFWMGVPTLTLLGQRVVGRAGYSQLCNLGLSELAAQTREEYVELVASWAGDLSRLQQLRACLRERMRQSPLMDGKRFARHMEEAYRHMWQRWCRGDRLHFGPEPLPGTQ
jgi:predicted O-linked N-acetylglucosamine transferase (SPINDLY family)